MICEYYKFIPRHDEDDEQEEAVGVSSEAATAAASEGGETEKKASKRAKLDADDANESTTASSSTKQSSPSQQQQQVHVQVVPKIEIMPALGTHAPMTSDEIRKMFGDELANKHEQAQHQKSSSSSSSSSSSPFLVHDWRNDVVTIGHAPAELVRKATNGLVDKPWPAQLNKLVWDKRLDKQQKDEKITTSDTAAGGSSSSSSSNNKPRPLVLSIGQVVPHEVMGMANFNKNLLVGTGGVEAINLSHFIGAIHGMERMMGRKHNPLRDILNYASQHFLEQQLDLWYILTVVSPSSTITCSATTTAKKDDEQAESTSNNNSDTCSDSGESSDNLCIRGLYVGRDIQCYSAACDLSLKVNFTLLDEPLNRCVVYLGSDEFHSTWLSNKAIYRTRMAMADGGKLIILAPGVERFGEDDRVDALIRKYGYVGTPKIMQLMEQEQELRDNLSAVAHLIHGSSEGRFEVVYCPGHLTKAEVEKAGFQYGNLEKMMERYNVKELKDGFNKDQDGEDFFYISNPALGLWAVKSRFETSSDDKPSS